MTKEQLDIINEIRLKMFYDPKKTLSEQSTVGAPNRGMVTPSEISQQFEQELLVVLYSNQVVELII